MGELDVGGEQLLKQNAKQSLYHGLAHFLRSPWFMFMFSNPKKVPRSMISNLKKAFVAPHVTDNIP